MTAPRSSVFTSVRRAPRRRWSSYAKVVAVLAVLLLVAAVATVVALWIQTNRALVATPVVALAETPPMIDDSAQAAAGGDEVAPGTVEVLVAGTHERDGSEATSFVSVVQVGPTRDEPVVLVLPLALEVDVPGAGRATLGSVGIDAGADDLVRTVQTYTGIDLEHYVLVDDGLLPDLAVAVDGARTCTDGGCRPVTPAQVQAVAERTPREVGPAAWLDSHLRMLDAVAAGARRPGTWLNPFAVNRVVDAVADNVTSDVELSALDLVAMARSADATRALDVRHVPGVIDPETGVVHARPEQAELLFAALRRPAPLPTDVGRDGPSQLDPADVSVLVLNGVGTAGLASDVAEVLSGAGFAVVATDNAERFDHTATEVAHGPNGALLAKLTAQQLPDAEVVAMDEAPEHDGEPVDVVVTVGRDWRKR